MAEEGTGARVVRNAFASGFGQFFGVAVSLALTPWVIGAVGSLAYGVFVLSLTFTFFGGYASLADLGIEGAAVRDIARARANGDAAAASAAASAAYGFFVRASLVIAPLLALVSLALPHLFHVPDELHNAAIASFVLVAAQLLFELPARAFLAVLEGIQLYTLSQAIEITRALVQSALFIVVIVVGGGIEWLAASLLAASAVVLVLSRALARRHAPEIRVRLSTYSRTTLRGMLRFGGGLLVLRTFGTVYRQMDKAILGIAIGVAPVTPYEIANRVHAAAAMVQTAASAALLPTSAYLQGRLAVLRDLYLRGSSYTVAVTLPVIVVGFVFAHPLISAWVGDRIADQAAGATRLFFVYLALALPHVVGSGVLIGLGRLRPLVLLSAAILVVNLGASIWLVFPLGIEGVVLGTVIAYALAFPVFLRIALDEFELTVREWVAAIVVPNLPGLALGAGVSLALLPVARRAGHLYEIAPLCLAAVIASFAGYLLLGLRAPQRRQLVTTLRRALGIQSA